MTGAADAKLACNAAGNDPAQRAQRAVGCQRAARAIAKPFRPLIGFDAVQACLASPIGGALLHGPAEMEIGAAQVEREADEDAAARSIELRISRVLQRRARGIQHEELLRQHFLQFARCDVEAPDRHGEVVEEIAGETAAPYAADLVGVQTAPLRAFRGLCLFFLV